jgi:hypothetical protein
MNQLSRTVFALFLIASSFASVFAQDPTPTPIENDDPESVFIEEIKVNVSAFDRFGDFIKNVDKDDLVISENGRLHQANSVSRIAANVLIVLDTGGELRRAKNISHTRDTAKELVKRLSSETNISTLEYHDRARILTEWTKDQTKILSDLDNKLFFGKRSIFTDALELATAVLSAPKLENRHLVLISDGTDSLWSEERRANALRALLKTNITVHIICYTRMEIAEIDPRSKRVQKPSNRKTLPQQVIDTLPNGVREVANTPNNVSVSVDNEMIRTLRQRKEALENGEEFLSELSLNTNGIFILPDDKDEMKEKTRVIAKAIDSNYVVTYTPKKPLADAKPGETRIIEVSSKKAGLIVQARRKLVIGDAPAVEQ